MKRIAILVLVIAASCSKSDSKKADESAPAANAADQGSGAGDHRHGGRMSEEGRRKRLEEMHAKLDTNGDGKLSPDELSKADGRMKFDDPASLDTNHDGDISVDELETAMKARREQMRGMHGGDNGPGSAGSAN